jgi:hypothetical protein
LSESAWQNWFVKHQRILCDRWLKVLPEQYGGDATFKIIWPAYQTEIINLKKQDEFHWGSWYSRHDGEMHYLGDSAAGPLGESITLSILLILLAGMIALYLKYLKQMPATMATTAPVSRKRKASAKARSGR